MKKPYTFIVLFLLLLASLDASAILMPIVGPNNDQLEKHPRKLKLKEKAAVWMLHRKMKKQIRKYRKQNRLSTDTTNCGQILLKTGDRMDVKILKISEESVRFKRCGEENGAELVLSKDDIYEILLPGDVVVFKNTGKTHSSHKSGGADAGRVVLIILGVLGGISLLGLLALLALFATLG